MHALAPTESTSPTDQRQQVNRLPRATYRLQLRADFGFQQISQQIEYLELLGISDLYLSPLFHARADSQHGYDVVDHNRIEPAFGDQQALRDLAHNTRSRQMGILLDIVPNHMGINDPDNQLWNDVLENGSAAQSAIFFDIDWNPPSGELTNSVLLPFLGRPFGETLEAGELQVVRIPDGFTLQYFDRRFPLNPASWTELLKLAEQAFPASGDVEERDELSSIITQLMNLAHCPLVSDRYREQTVARRRLQHLFRTSADTVAACDAALQQINGTVGNPASFDLLEQLLQQQYYRLAYWQVAVDEINYRRFFDINDLAAVRVEKEEVFTHLHRLTWELVQNGTVTGLRVDHIDGLLDPAEYFQRLQSDYRRTVEGANANDLYIVAEKILSGDESLKSTWRVSGTTGYELLNMLSQVMVDPQGLAKITSFYAELTHSGKPRDVGYWGKQAILSDAMASELYVLASRLYRIARANRRSLHFTLRGLLRALREVIACFPVYRSYVRPLGWDVDDQDRRRIREALRWAMVRNSVMPRSLFEFISGVLLLEFPAGLSEEQQLQWRDWVLRFQQVTGPVTAKGIEDTSFYRYYPLLSLNEVGAELGAEPLELTKFHQIMAERGREWPRSLSATATHDTKRGEDVRARLHVLSECPQELVDTFHSWQQSTQADPSASEEVDSNARYFIFQTLLGTWPWQEQEWGNYRDRLQAYFQKAFREAKCQTSWRSPNSEFEAAVEAFVDRSINDCRCEAFKQLDHLAQLIAGPGFINSVAQVVLKATVPGVPDFYQGCELWDFHLVDPDNRQPVDFHARDRMLRQLRERFEHSPTHTLSRFEKLSDPELKMFTTHRCLQARREAWDVFASGEYRALQVVGDKSAHVIAFERRFGQRSVFVIAPRLPLGFLKTRSREVTLRDFLGEAWGDTRIVLDKDQPNQLREALTDCSVDMTAGQTRVANVLRNFCAAILL